MANRGQRAARPATGADNPPILYDPTTTSCAGSVCTRQPFGHTRTASPPTTSFPPGDALAHRQGHGGLSPETDAIPASLYNNYLGGTPQGFDDRPYDWRVDYDLNSKQRISTVGVNGARIYLTKLQQPVLPTSPYVIGGTYAKIYPTGLHRGARLTPSPRTSSTSSSTASHGSSSRRSTPPTAQGVYKPSAFGITNTPAGQGSTEFPGRNLRHHRGLRHALHRLDREWRRHHHAAGEPQYLCAPRQRAVGQGQALVDLRLHLPVGGDQQRGSDRLIH